MTTLALSDESAQKVARRQKNKTLTATISVDGDIFIHIYICVCMCKSVYVCVGKQLEMLTGNEEK